MRLPAEAFRRLVLLASTAAVAGCAIVGGDGRSAVSASAPAADPAERGPAADYPVILGDPFSVDGVVYTPADTLNYDVVGYAGSAQLPGVAVAHRTLPIPSYVEVTSLDSGRTILARVAARGPMTGARLIDMSPAALAQLATVDGAPVRVRRVNPPETDRAALRSGSVASARIDTPKGLVEVLRRKLPPTGSADLRAAIRTRTPSNSPDPVAPPGERPEVQTAAAPRSPAVASQPATQRDPVTVAPSKDSFVVQAGTFSSEENARKAAARLGGFVAPAGKLYRVRTGPFADRADAEAALAKVRAAGYSDARVYTAG